MNYLMKIAKNLFRKKNANHFKFSVLVVTFTIVVSLIAFMTEESKISGYSTYTSQISDSNQVFNEYENVEALGTLAKGNYYIDNDGYVYWIEPYTKPLVARVKHLDESQKNRQIYIDSSGNIGYVLSQ